MTGLADRVHIAQRFQRSARIDTDLEDAGTLDGFVCPASSADVLRTMARHVSETDQGAFIWTGPYGSGKSSLALLLSALLSGDKRLRTKAESAVGAETASEIWSALEPKTKGWKILPVVGRRDDPVSVIGEAIAQLPELAGDVPKTWTESLVLETLESLASKTPKSSGGLIVFLDEMGKFLEAATRGSADVFIFQQLAELASRSKGRLIVVGVLHQAFEEYAHQLSREMRDEWSKIQGRFVDQLVNIAGDEQLELLSRAIESDHVAEKPSKSAKSIANVISSTRPGVSQDIAMVLENCWPLHPIVAASLGPISRQRFGQNQRSVFGFLNSSEVGGFQDFLSNATAGDLYDPAGLWDYLRLNLESSILSSPDAHRWSIAFEAVERCEGLGGNRLQVDLLKTIALVDLLKSRSGLIANKNLLRVAARGATLKAIDEAIKQLEDWSLIVYRKFASSYAIFAGSDFDINDALARALEDIANIDLNNLHKLAGLQPILAKRHYHETGAQRWFDIAITTLEDVATQVESYEPSAGAIGQFVIALPANGEAEQEAKETCQAAARKAGTWFSIVGLSPRFWTVTELARDLALLEHVQDTSSELASDAVARRELRARIALTQGYLEEELQYILDNALWYQKGHKPVRLTRDELHRLTTKLADRKFEKTPLLKNELLNRAKPSTSAVAAQKALLRRMVVNEHEPRLGIEGFPAEGGLYASLLDATRLHKQTSGKWKFVKPEQGNDPCSLSPVWKAATDYLKQNNDRSVSASEIFAVWESAPFGIKGGLMPVLLVAYVLSVREKIAFYRQGIFQSDITDLEIDYLAKSPDHIQLRWMDLSKTSSRLLSDMADLVRELDSRNSLQDLKPVDVARGLIAIYDNFPSWTSRTMRLSKIAIQVRHLFKQANDPNKFLFDDIPALLKNFEVPDNSDTQTAIVERVRAGLQELSNAYPSMLNRLRETLLAELQVPSNSTSAIAELNERAQNIQEISGDFRLEAFVGRLRDYNGSDSATEAIASLAVNKPPSDWVDPDINQTTLGLAEMAREFVRLEAFAHIKGRPDKRNAMAVVVGLDGHSETFSGEFSITDTDRQSVDTLMSQINTALEKANDHQRDVLFYSMAELVAQHLGNQASYSSEKNQAREEASTL